jgi:hypothetical protein
MDDTAYQDVELAGRKDVISTSAEVDAVQVDGPQGHACRGHPRWDGQGVAMRLIEDKKSEEWPGQELGVAHTINCMSLRKPLRVSGMCEFWTRIRGRIWSGGIRRRRIGSGWVAWYRWRWTNRSIKFSSVTRNTHTFAHRSMMTVR